MLKALLVQLGLAKAPLPVRKYAAFSSVFGTLPVAMFVGYKYRHQIASLVRRFTQHEGVSAAEPAI